MGKVLLLPMEMVSVLCKSEKRRTLAFVDRQEGWETELYPWVHMRISRWKREIIFVFTMHSFPEQLNSRAVEMKERFEAVLSLAKQMGYSVTTCPTSYEVTIRISIQNFTPFGFDRVTKAMFSYNAVAANCILEELNPSWGMEEYA